MVTQVTQVHWYWHVGGLLESNESLQYVGYSYILFRSCRVVTLVRCFNLSNGYSDEMFQASNEVTLGS